MSKWVLMVAAAAILAASQSQARVGSTYLTAYDQAKGSRVKVAKYGSQILLRSPSQVRHSPADTAKSGKKMKGKMPPNSFTERVTFCGRPYYTTKRGKRWIAAHKKAHHVLLVRYHQGKRKYKVVCGTRPKGAAHRPMHKNTKPRPKNS